MFVEMETRTTAEMTGEIGATCKPTLLYTLSAAAIPCLDTHGVRGASRHRARNQASTHAAIHRGHA